MVLQFEDCVDILQYMYPDFDFIFLFDHSNGHDRMQPNGLNINKIGIRFGGKQPHMRHTLIRSPNQLGPYHNSSYDLQIGMHQSLQFSENDQGPCYLNEIERNKQRYDRDTGKMRTRELTVSSLICKLKEFGLSDPRGSKKELQDLCKSLNITISVTEPDILEGWVGKPKGALQLLFERGWIDPDNIKMYTAKGKAAVAGSSSSDGNDYSIRNLMKLQEDFTDEITLLQYHAQQLGVRVDRTPKCHPEVAGEGIEYAWGIAKLFYCRSDIREKRNKNSFMTLVRKATDSTGELDINRIQSCSRRA